MNDIQAVQEIIKRTIIRARRYRYTTVATWAGLHYTSIAKMASLSVDEPPSCKTLYAVIRSLDEMDHLVSLGGDPKKDSRESYLKATGKMKGESHETEQL